MGKNSLIKSTAKKKKTAGKSKTTEPVTAEKPTPKPETPPGPTVADEKKPDAKKPDVKKQDEKKPDVKKQDKSVPPPVEKPAPSSASGEKPAIEKKPSPEKSEPEPQVTITYEAPSEPATADPVDKIMLIAAGAILFLFILVIGASLSNTSRYYIKKKPMGVEIWQGKFAPLGEKKVIDLPDVTVPAGKKTVFTQNDVYPLIFSHYLNKADALLTRPGIPDYESIKAYLTRAQDYAVNAELAAAASKRLVAIDFNNLLYRASIVGGRQTVKDLEKALDYLAEASQLKLNANQLDQVTLQRKIFQEMLAKLRKAEATTE